VGILSGSSHLLYDSLIRSEGSSNPAVIRDTNSQEVIQINNVYENLDSREISGVDIGLVYDFETSLGDFEFTANAAHLSKFEQVADSVSAQLVAAQNAANPAVPADRTIANVGDLIKQNGNPEWRARTSLNWKRSAWGAGISAKYTSEVVDTSTTATVDGEVLTLPVDSYTTVNVYGSYKFEEGDMLEGLKLSLGIRNVGDKEPPLADELAHGYFGSLHSNRGRYYYINVSKTF
jgi:outer membrane receptor protein involved in Fe transport